MSWQVDGFEASLTTVSDATKTAYLGDVRHFVEWAERADLDGPGDVSRLVLRRHLAYLTTMGRQKRTIARRASSLRRYFGWLCRAGHIPVDPSRGLSAPAGDSRLPRVLRAAEIETLLDDPPARVDADPEAIRLRDDALLELLYGSGLRVAELCGLNLGDVDAKRGVVVVTGKGSKQRQVPISEPAGEAVIGWVRDGRGHLVTDRTPPDALFLNRRGSRLGPRDVRRILDRRAPS